MTRCMIGRDDGESEGWMKKRMEKEKEEDGG